MIDAILKEAQFLILDDVAKYKPLYTRWVNETNAKITMKIQINRLLKLIDLSHDDKVNLYSCLDQPELYNTFVSLLNTLVKYRARVTYESLRRMYQRLLALKQTNILTYLRHTDLLVLIKDNQLITGTDIVNLCFKSEVGLNAFNDFYRNPQTVEFRIRDLLGIAMDKDIPTAFKQWSVIHHPDKGGDAKAFALVNVTYQEWREQHDTRHISI